MRYDNTAKEWGALGTRSLVPSAITYEPKINSRTVQGERTGARAWQQEEDPTAAQILYKQTKGGGQGRLTGRLDY